MLTESLFGIGAVLMWIGSRTVSDSIRRSRWIKYATYAGIVHVVLGVAAIPGYPLSILMAGITVLGALELVRALRAARNRRFWLALPAYLAGATGLLWSTLPSFEAHSGHAGFSTFFVLVCIFDAFSQLTGQIAGGRRLAPALSPGKTIAGAVGGLVATTFACFFLMVMHPLAGSDMPMPPVVPLLFSLAVASLCCGFALLGDLTASWVKRQCGLKDFGAMLPGHGGILDRFDSLFGVGVLLLLIGRLRMPM